jgi:hypothetical protein
MRSDPNPYRPSPRAVFTLDEYRRSFGMPTLPKTDVTRARNRLVESIHSAGQAAALLEGTPDQRSIAHRQAEAIRTAQRELRDALGKLPKR